MAHRPVPGPLHRAKRRPALLTAEMLSGRRPWLVAKPVGATSVAGNNGSELLRSGRFSRLSVLDWLFARLFARRVACLFVQIRRLDEAVREAHELRVLSLVQIDLSQGVVVRPRGSDSPETRTRHIGHGLPDRALQPGDSSPRIGLCWLRGPGEPLRSPGRLAVHS